MERTGAVEVDRAAEAANLVRVGRAGRRWTELEQRGRQDDHAPRCRQVAGPVATTRELPARLLVANHGPRYTNRTGRCRPTCRRVVVVPVPSRHGVGWVVIDGSHSLRQPGLIQRQAIGLRGGVKAVKIDAAGERIAASVVVSNPLISRDEVEAVHQLLFMRVVWRCILRHTGPDVLDQSRRGRGEAFRPRQVVRSRVTERARSREGGRTNRPASVVGEGQEVLDVGLDPRRRRQAPHALGGNATNRRPLRDRVVVVSGGGVVTGGVVPAAAPDPGVDLRPVVEVHHVLHDGGVGAALDVSRRPQNGGPRRRATRNERVHDLADDVVDAVVVGEQSLVVAVGIGIVAVLEVQRLHLDAAFEPAQHARHAGDVRILGNLARGDVVVDLECLQRCGRRGDVARTGYEADWHASLNLPCNLLVHVPQALVDGHVGLNINVLGFDDNLECVDLDLAEVVGDGQRGGEGLVVCTGIGLGQFERQRVADGNANNRRTVAWIPHRRHQSDRRCVAVTHRCNALQDDRTAGIDLVRLVGQTEPRHGANGQRFARIADAVVIGVGVRRVGKGRAEVGGVVDAVAVEVGIDAVVRAVAIGVGRVDRPRLATRFDVVGRTQVIDRACTAVVIKQAVALRARISSHINSHPRYVARASGHGDVQVHTSRRRDLSQDSRSRGRHAVGGRCGGAVTGGRQRSGIDATDCQRKTRRASAAATGAEHRQGHGSWRVIDSGEPRRGIAGPHEHRNERRKGQQPGPSVHREKGKCHG